MQRVFTQGMVLRVIQRVNVNCSLLAESHPPFWAMFRLSESNGKLVSLLPSERSFAEGNWAGGKAFACVPTYRVCIPLPLREGWGGSPLTLDL